MRKKLITLITLLTAVLLVCFGITACGEAELASPKNVKYDGAVITWDTVPNADKYMVSIDNGEQFGVSSNSHAYATAAKTFTIKICASNSEGSNQSPETVMSFIMLDKITAINVVDGIASWSPVETATAYEVKVAGKDGVVTVTDTTYAPEEAGNYNIMVRPVVTGNSSYWSRYSPSKSFTILGTVAKDDIKYEDGEIRWKGVSSAAGYEVSVNGMVFAENCTTNKVTYDAQNTDFQVSIRALGNGTTTFNGAMSEEKSFIYLDTVTNANVVDGTLVWDAVTGATGYKIKLNGALQNKVYTECKFEGLQVNRNTAISILPICDDTTYFSEWSAEKNVFILPAPVLLWNSELELDGENNSNTYWNPIAGAKGYSVKVVTPSGEEQVNTYSETQAFYQDTYSEVGEYKVYVKSNSNNTDNVYDSAYSTPLSITRLPAPTPLSENFITSDANNVTNGFTVSFNHVQAASRYTLYQGENEVQSATTAQFVVGNPIGDNVIEEQKYNYHIRAIGSVSADGKTIYLSSLTSTALAFDITVLSMPTQLDISGYTLTFGGVSNNNGYCVTGVSDTPLVVSQTSADLSHISEGGKEIRVCTRGNGAQVLPSNYTAAINVVRLDAPTNVRINAQGAEGGLLEFSGPDTYATGYTVTFDNSNEQVPVAELTNIIHRITTQGTTLHMYSVANCFNTERTTYYMTSNRSLAYQFIKLATPTFGDKAFTDTELVWNAPSNINPAEYTPTYEVARPNMVEYNGEKNGTRFSLDGFEGGQSYEFVVKAIGNGTKYIDSDVSSTVSVYKLATPELRRENGQYVFDGVSNGVSYALYIDGEAVYEPRHLAGTTYAHTPLFEEIGEYEVKLVAVGDGGYTTINSPACTLVQKTMQLSTPDFTLSYSNETFIQTGEIIVTIDAATAPAYATGYSYTIKDATGTSAEGEFRLNPNTVGRFPVRVFALGGSFDEEGNYWLNSQSSAQKTITLLAQPSWENLKLTEDGMLSWVAVDGTARYELKVAVDGGEFAEVIPVNSTMYDISKLIKDASSVCVQIVAVGNGTSIISSAVTERDWQLH